MSRPSSVLFPRISQVLESRVDLIKLVRDQYVDPGQDAKDAGPIWLEIPKKTAGN